MLSWAGRGGSVAGLAGGGKHRHSGVTGSGRHGKTRATNGASGATTGRHTKPGSTGTGTHRNSAGNGPLGQAKSNKPSASGRSGTVKAAVGRATRAAGKAAGAGGGLAARGARAGWKMTAPVRAAGRKTLAGATKAATAGLVRQIKKTPGVITDGLVAGAAGLLSGLWRRSFRAGGGRIRDVWRKLRARRARKQAEKAPDPITPTSSAVPVGTAVRRPLSATFTQTTTTGGTVMSGGHHFVAPAMEMARIAANYQPQGMLQVGEDFAGLSEALALHAEAMKTTVENADASWPLDPQVVDLMRQIYGLQIKAAELARELKPAFEQLHGVDLNRLRNPRKSAQAESMWDVRTNL
jgi:hypothetical protein